MNPAELPPTRVPFVPELVLHLAPADVPLIAGDFSTDVPPPFWAFAWAGGRALARHVLDHPELVRGRTVLDVAAGGGVAAVAAAVAGAARVTAFDRDPAAAAAIRRNAEANGVTVEAQARDVTDAPPDDVDVVLAGDVFYEPSTAGRMRAFLRAAARAGAMVLVGDPGRGYFPERMFTELARYDVPVPHVLEDTKILPTRVWQARNVFVDYKQ